jgi:transposase
VAFFKVQASRSKAAFEALVKHWAGILVSDGYGVYCQWVHARQTCLAHLIRRARGLAERKDPELAGFGRRVLAELQRCNCSGGLIGQIQETSGCRPLK